MTALLRGCLVVLGLLLGLAACRADATGPGAPAATDSAAVRGTAEASYTGEMLLQGALTDTLGGPVAFGRVLDTRTGKEKFVIALDARGDLASGVYLVRYQPEPPPPGTYDLVPHAGADSVAYEGFALVYREGLRRQLTSTAGTLRLTTVRDTLIEGSFEATLRGTVAAPGEQAREVSLNARGSFRARDGSVGYVMGL